MPKYEILEYYGMQMIGWRESVSLPDLGLVSFRAKADTGARTTALHATNIACIEVNGQPWVEFLPDHNPLVSVNLSAAPIHHLRNITNTSGIPEKRFIIATRLRLGKREAQIEVSLTDRSDMRFPIIIGRTAMKQLRLTVDPSRSWLQSPEILSSTQKEKK